MAFPWTWIGLGALLWAAPAPRDPRDVGFTTLAGFEYVPGMQLPGEVASLDQIRVRVRGFMQREDEGSGPVSCFMLINDACGCLGTPKLNEIVFCDLPEGRATKLLPGVVTVIGTLTVGEEKEDGEVLGIYFLDVETVL
jgi:hypothetical protein